VTPINIFALLRRFLFHLCRFLLTLCVLHTLFSIQCYSCFHSYHLLCCSFTQLVFCFVTVLVMSRNCSSNYPCPENQECIFTGDGYGFCICPKGFTLDANGHCRDINECSEMNDWDLCGYNAQCVNTAGAYECACLPGFTGNGKQGCTRICK